MQLAKIIGLNEAVILQQVHYWCTLNKKNKKNLNDGEYWVFQTFEEWSDQFPFGLRTTKTVFKKLEDAGFLIVGNYNKMRIDRTKWYRVNYKLLEVFINQPLCNNCTLPSCRYCTKDCVKVARAIQETIKETNVQEINKHKTGEQVHLMTLSNFLINDSSDYETKVVADAVEYYYERYEEMMNKKHPKLKKPQLYRIFDEVLEPIVNEYGLDEEKLKEMIDLHFERKTDKHDYNINAFASWENVSILYERVK
jgi:hypothetical protein